MSNRPHLEQLKKYMQIGGYGWKLIWQVLAKIVSQPKRDTKNHMYMFWLREVKVKFAHNTV